MRTFCLTEHASLRVGERAEVNQLTISEVEALDKAQKAMGCEAFRWTNRNRIKACQFVGVIAAPTIRLEILPKIDGVAEGQSRAALMRMIAAAMNIPLHDGEITALNCQNQHLLELLISLFSQKLYTELRKGLTRHYVRRSDDLSKLRGKLNVTRQMTRLIHSATASFGKPIIPREWFLVPLFVIDEAVEMIREGSVSEYVYDGVLARLVEQVSGDLS